jgi:hypothetical protein
LTLSFSAPIVHSSVEGSLTLATADFNRDGKPDLAGGLATSHNTPEMPTPDGHDVQIELGNGDGTFTDAATYQIGGIAPRELWATDLDGDNSVDLIVSSMASSKGDLDVLLGTNGGCGLEDSSTFLARAFGGDFVGDLNGDGFSDFAVINSPIDVMFGTSTGALMPQVSLPLHPLPSASLMLLTGSDLNDDGNIDLITADNNGAVYVILGSGGGAFGPVTLVPATSNIGAPPVQLFTTDLTSDRLPDLVLLLVASSGSEMVTLAGRGDGTFDKLQTISSGVSAPLVPADLNGDGVVDLVGLGNPLYVYLGMGGGALASPTHVPISGSFSDNAVIGDFNSDGLPDIALGGPGIQLLTNSSK